MRCKLALFFVFCCVAGLVIVESADVDKTTTKGFMPAFNKNVELSTACYSFEGRQNFLNGSYEEAVGYYDQAIADLLNNKGAALYNMGYRDEAIECFEAALEIYRWHPQAIKNLDIAEPKNVWNSNVHEGAAYDGDRGVQNVFQPTNIVGVTLNGVTYTCKRIDPTTGECLVWNPPLPYWASGGR